MWKFMMANYLQFSLTFHFESLTFTTCKSSITLVTEFRSHSSKLLVFADTGDKAQGSEGPWEGQWQNSLAQDQGPLPAALGTSSLRERTLDFTSLALTLKRLLK